MRSGVLTTGGGWLVFRIVDTEIKPFGLTDPACGGITSFEGVVRNHNENRAVEALEYEAYQELAEKEGAVILQEALSKFDVNAIKAEHRVGRLAIGDVAIRVEAAAEHRKAAFEACEYVVEEVKRRVPIWKRELYSDGSGDWLKTEPASQDSIALSDQERGFYDRQLTLLSVEQQLKLKSSNVVVVGAGGLGCPALVTATG